jgi:hypothetical protein
MEKSSNEGTLSFRPGVMELFGGATCMSSSKYHREQAEIFAGLALSTSNENEANWYKLIAKDQLERALREPMHKYSAPETPRILRRSSRA